MTGLFQPHNGTPLRRRRTLLRRRTLRRRTRHFSFERESVLMEDCVWKELFCVYSAAKGGQRRSRNHSSCHSRLTKGSIAVFCVRSPSSARLDNRSTEGRGLTKFALNPHAIRRHRCTSDSSPARWRSFGSRPSALPPDRRAKAARRRRGSGSTGRSRMTGCTRSSALGSTRRSARGRATDRASISTSTWCTRRGTALPSATSSS